jgi:hypothetical protein
MVVKSFIFLDITPCSLLKVDSRALLATCFMLVSVLAYSATLKMEVTCSSKTSVDFWWATWRYILENRTLLLIVCLSITMNFVRMFTVVFSVGDDA